MDRLSEMEAFVTVVDAGGFTGAATKLGISKSAVSKSISALEHRLGARLLDRTTRRVNPTEIGLSYYDRAKSVLAYATDADEMVTAMQSSPRGVLRISVAFGFGLQVGGAAVSAFLKSYPDVSAELVLDDRYVDLIKEGFDLAIRIGNLEDSSLKARKIAETQMVMVASSGYLAQNGTPHSIDELSAHQLLHYSMMSTGKVWRIRSRSGEVRDVRTGGCLSANNGDILNRAAIAGLGVAFCPSFMVCDYLKSGELVQVLADHPQPETGVHLVYPSGLYTQPKVRAFIDFMVEYFKGRGSMDW